MSNPREWPEISYFESGSERAESILNELEKVETKNWFTLFRAPVDNSYWRIEAWDKYQQQYLLRIDDLENWDTIDSTELQKKLLQNNRGVSEDECAWKGCSKPSLKGLAFCVDHAYNQGLSCCITTASRGRDSHLGYSLCLYVSVLSDKLQ